MNNKLELFEELLDVVSGHDGGGSSWYNDDGCPRPVVWGRGKHTRLGTLQFLAVSNS